MESIEFYDPLLKNNDIILNYKILLKFIRLNIFNKLKTIYIFTN
jgi:hypothetical protein